MKETDAFSVRSLADNGYRNQIVLRAAAYGPGLHVIDFQATVGEELRQPDDAFVDMRRGLELDLAGGQRGLDVGQLLAHASRARLHSRDLGQFSLQIPALTSYGGPALYHWLDGHPVEEKRDRGTDADPGSIDLVYPVSFWNDSTHGIYPLEAALDDERYGRAAEKRLSRTARQPDLIEDSQALQAQGKAGH